MGLYSQRGSSALATVFLALAALMGAVGEAASQAHPAAQVLQQVPTTAESEDVLRIHVGATTGSGAGLRVTEQASGTVLRIGGARANTMPSPLGLHDGDRIVTLAGCRVRSVADWQSILRHAGPDALLEIGVLRARQTGLGRADHAGVEDDFAGPESSQGSLVRLKIPLNEAIALADPAANRRAPDWEDLSLADASGSVLIEAVPVGLQTLIRPGDLLLAIDSIVVHSSAHARSLLSAGPHKIRVVRAGKRLDVPALSYADSQPLAPRSPDSPCPP